MKKQKKNKERESRKNKIPFQFNLYLIYPKSESIYSFQSRIEKYFMKIFTRPKKIRLLW